MKLTLNELKPSDFVDKFLWQSAVKNESEFTKALEEYKSNLQTKLDIGSGEDAIVSDALKPFFKTLGFETHTKLSQTQIGATSTLSAIDLALTKDKDDKSVNVIIEAKKPNSNDFITPSDANKKALHECILYYFRERKNGLNFNLKFIIITDYYNFYFFKADDFKNIFLIKNKKFEELFKNYNGTDEFYKGCEEIINSDKFFESKSIPTLHLSINDFAPENPNKSKAFYKAFSRENLLGEFSYDPNKISKKFYDELLYILGLQEDRKTGILSSNGVKGSLLENINSRLEMPSFETAMQLLILWLNRLLFLKLIETNLLNFNKNSVGGGAYRP